MATCEGLSDHLQQETNDLYKDPEKWRRWLEILIRSYNDAEILGIGEHLIHIVRKT
jgi:hypothetical protein